MIHLVKLCVGAESIEDLEHWQDRVVGECKRAGLPPFPFHDTRQTPKRREELLEGGSLYWVIKGTILVRQEIEDLVSGDDRNGKSFCRILLKPKLFRTDPQGRRAFQGWRYLKPEDAPADLSSNMRKEVPAELTLALKDAGVW